MGVRLGGSLVGEQAAKWLASGNRELHVPEIHFWGDKFHADVLLAIARAMNGNDTSFHGLRRVIVDEDQFLANDNDLFEVEQSAIAIDGLRDGLSAKLIAVVEFSLDSQRHGKRYAHRAPPLFAPKMK